MVIHKASGQSFQNADDSWSANFLTPETSDTLKYDYSEADRYIYMECDGSTGDNLNNNDYPWNISCFDQVLQGNADGTVFTYFAEGSMLEAECEGDQPPKYVPVVMLELAHGYLVAGTATRFGRN